MDENNEERSIAVAMDTTDIVIAENAQKIKARDGSKVFPISVALRKKLEHLKQSSMSDLKTRIQFIKQEKHDEYMESQEYRIVELSQYVEKKNKQMRSLVERIMQKNRISEAKISISRQKVSLVHKKAAKDFYHVADAIIQKEPDYIGESVTYNFPLRGMRPKKDTPIDDEYNEEEKKVLDKAEQIKLAKEDAKSYTLVFDAEKYRKNVIEKEFKDKFGKPFDMAVSRINQLELQFDESLLFGDMEVVKNVYYNLRQAEKFIEDLSKMELR